MKFNKHISLEVAELLEKQYKEYIKVTPMTKKEQRVLREWVKDGNSVYQNTCDAWYDGQVPVPFLDVYREEEYIRQQTKGMNSEEARKFALAYYGWDDEPDATSYEDIPKGEPLIAELPDIDLPFN